MYFSFVSFIFFYSRNIVAFWLSAFDFDKDSEKKISETESSTSNFSQGFLLTVDLIRRIIRWYDWLENIEIKNEHYTVTDC